MSLFMEESEQPLWYRQPLIILASLFLLFLVISFTFTDAIQGIIQSKVVINNQLVFPNATIIFANGALELIQQEYLSNPEREIKACLYGEVNNSLYYIARAVFPKILRANAIHVVSSQCPDVLIDLHSHPINSCLASDQDIAAYKELKTTNPDVRMLVMCSKSRFALIPVLD